MNIPVEHVFRDAEDSGAAPLHPGEVLREDILPHLDLTAREFARHLALPLWELEDVLMENRPITVDLAVRLGSALPHGARYWLALQLQHDVWRAAQAQASGVKPLEWRKRSHHHDSPAMRT